MWGEKKPPNKLPKTEISKKIYSFKIIMFLFFFNYDTDNNIMAREHNAVRNVPWPSQQGRDVWVAIFIY